MASPEIRTRAVGFRPLTAAVVVLLLLGAGGVYLMRAGVAPSIVQQPVSVAPVVAPSLPGVASSAPSVAVAPSVPPAPSFDVVRVSPQGNAVIAGRAEAGAEVVVLDGRVEIARTRADRRGEFVALPVAPLGAGGRELTLAARGSTGENVRGDGAVVVVVPERAPERIVLDTQTTVSGVPGQGVTPQVVTGPGPVALLVPSLAPPRVLQGSVRGGVGLSLDVVDYDEKGAVRFTGSSAMGSAVRVYVDNGAVGDARTDVAGRWSLTPAGEIAAGVHALRADSLDGAGRVMARVELPFQRAQISSVELASGHVVVQPGQNLWRLARAAYGRGVRYTVIYLANQEQIRDPRLIYPGQAFAVPADGR